MRKLGRTSTDALELLLDTVCSMFGAILLIAILVALMAQTVKVETPADQASAEMMHRRIATAEADLAKTRRLIAEAAAPSGGGMAELVAEKEKLEQELERAKSQRKQMSSQVQDLVAQETTDFSTEWKKLTGELRALQRHLQEVANEIKTQDENRARLEGRIAEINKLIQKEKDAHLVTLRFPKERARSKKSFAIICKFGKIYPLYDTDGATNDKTIAWSNKGPDSRLSKPIESLGWTMSDNKMAVDQLLKSAPKEEFYLAFYVYPDSFEAFRSLRDQAALQQLEFGVQFERAGNDLFWGSKGSSPPPL
jgi:hypothetical protein